MSAASCPNCGHPVVWHGETGENQCKRRDMEGRRCPCQRNMPATNAPRCLEFDDVVLNGMTCSIDRGRHIHTPVLTERPCRMKRLAIWAVALADRFRTAVDKRVCQISNDLSGDDGDE